MIVQCICQQLRTIRYGYIKRCQLCEIQFAWNLNPTWHNRWGMHISLNRPRLKSCHAVFDEKIASAPASGQSVDRGAVMWRHVVRSRLTIWGAMSSWIQSCYFARHLTAKNSRNHKMQYYNHRIALKFNWHLGSIATDRFAKFQSDWQCFNPILRFRYFTKSCSKSSYCFENKSLCLFVWFPHKIPLGILVSLFSLIVMCEIQFAWNLNPTWHNRWGMLISLNRPRLKSCHAVFDEKIAPAPGSGQSVDRGAVMWMHVVRSRLTIWGAMSSWIQSCYFARHLTAKNSRNHKMQYYNHRIAMKFNWHLGSIATDRFAKFQSDWQCFNPILRFRYFTKSCSKSSCCFENKSLCLFVWFPHKIPLGILVSLFSLIVMFILYIWINVISTALSSLFSFSHVCVY